MALTVFQELQINLADAKDRFRLFHKIRQPADEIVRFVQGQLKIAEALSVPIPTRRQALDRAIKNIQQLEGELAYQLHRGLRRKEARA
jgi:hypothetical protein